MVVSQSLEAYYNRFACYPNEIFIHAKTFFDNPEWTGFEKAVAGKSRIIGVRIRENSAFKLYRQYSYCVPRGMMLQYVDRKAFLWTKGFIPRFKTQIGLETPNPIDVAVTRGEADREQFGDQRCTGSLLKAEHEVSDFLLFCRKFQLMRYGIIVVDIETQCPVHTQLAPEPVSHGIIAANEIAFKGEFQDVVPLLKGLLVLDPEHFAVVSILSGQPHTDPQAVIETP